MGKVFITGDIHGEISVNRLAVNGFPEGKELTKDDYVIIVGDFGLVWNMDKQDKYWLKWLHQKPWTTLFIDGNHENHDMLDAMPIETWNGGKVHRINDSVFHLMRGQMFTLHGKKYFTFGGASSVDIANRKEGISWWKREIPSYAEFEEGMKTLDEHDWKPDIILTHTCPTSTLNAIASQIGFHPKPVDAVNVYLETLVNKGLLLYKVWFFGHFHLNKNFANRQVLIYDQIIEIP